MNIARLGLLAVILLASCGGADPVAPTVLPPPLAVSAPARFPTLVVNTASAAPVTSRETYVGGAWTLIGPDSVLIKQGTLDIRGRGNSTWTMPKKPYRLRLTSSTELLGMPANRHWALLANYADKTLLRNDLVFGLARRMGWSYVPRAQFVHLQLNGRYDGVYQLAEHIRVEANRVDIPELRIGDTSATTITGGYLLEVDQTYDEDFCWNTPRAAMPVCAKSPETLRRPGWEKQQAYITSYLRETEDALFGPDFADLTSGYAAYIDVASAVDYFLLNELVKNVDGNMRRSTFLTKPRGGKLYFGPLWDYDLTIGNVNYDGGDATAGWQIRSSPWYARLWQDPAFVQRVKLRWQQIRNDGTLSGWRSSILARWDYMSVEQRRNFERWPILTTWVWPNRVVPGSYDGEMAALQAWLSARTNWLDEQLKP